jgi:hypothetical protein
VAKPKSTHFSQHRNRDYIGAAAPMIMTHENNRREGLLSSCNSHVTHKKYRDRRMVLMRVLLKPGNLTYVTSTSDTGTSGAQCSGHPLLVQEPSEIQMSMPRSDASCLQASLSVPPKALPYTTGPAVLFKVYCTVALSSATQQLKNKSLEAA